MGRVFKVALALNGMALALIILEVLMGPTILGNVIFLGLAILLAFTGGAVGVVALLEQAGKGPAVIVLMSALLIAYVVYRFYSDTVPAGYGP